MGRKQLFFIISITIVIFIVISITTRIRFKNNMNNLINSKLEFSDRNIQTKIDEETNEKIYYITDENGEIIHEALDPTGLVVYEYDPDYDPKVEDVKH